MVNVKDILSLTPETLSKQQHDLLKKAVIERLNKVTSLIQEEKYSKVNEYLAYSPSGDCMGCENHYISFDDILELSEDGTDISDIIERLSKLKSMCSE